MFAHGAVTHRELASTSCTYLPLCILRALECTIAAMTQSTKCDAVADAQCASRCAAGGYWRPPRTASAAAPGVSAASRPASGRTH
eukprot:scaffold109357_cov69-Phaeocystis_antarctica.AAC.1